MNDEKDLKTVSGEFSPDKIQCVIFSAGDFSAGIEARHVVSLDFTMHGNAEEKNAGENHSISLKILAGLPNNCLSTPRYRLVIKETDGEKEVLTDSAELMEIPASNIYPLPAFIALRTKLQYLTALAFLPQNQNKKSSEELVLIFEVR